MRKIKTSENLLWYDLTKKSCAWESEHALWFKRLLRRARLWQKMKDCNALQQLTKFFKRICVGKKSIWQFHEVRTRSRYWKLQTTLVIFRKNQFLSYAHKNRCNVAQLKVCLPFFHIATYSEEIQNFVCNWNFTWNQFMTIHSGKMKNSPTKKYFVKSTLW